MGIASSSYQPLVGLALATSANGAARNGATKFTASVEPGTFLALCEARITTSSVVATFKVQVTDDGTTYYDLKLPNNAANVATAAGTGSEVITYLALSVPASAHAAKGVRVAVTLSGATTDAADKTQVDYRWIKYGALTRG